MWKLWVEGFGVHGFRIYGSGILKALKLSAELEVHSLRLRLRYCNACSRTEVHHKDGHNAYLETEIDRLKRPRDATVGPGVLQTTRGPDSGDVYSVEIREGPR